MSCSKRRYLSNEEYFKLYHYTKLNDTSLHSEFIQTYIKPHDTLQLFFNSNGILLKEKRSYTSIILRYIPSDSFYDKQIIDTTYISKVDSFYAKKRVLIIKPNTPNQLHPNYHIDKLNIYKSNVIYTNTKGISSYLTISYYPRSRLIKEEYFYNSEGLLHGPSFKHYKKPSRLYAEYNYKEGKLEGATVFYYKSGAVKQVDNYKSDSLINSIIYNINGK